MFIIELAVLYNKKILGKCIKRKDITKKYISQCENGTEKIVFKTRQSLHNHTIYKF